MSIVQLVHTEINSTGPDGMATKITGRYTDGSTFVLQCGPNDSWHIGEDFNAAGVRTRLATFSHGRREGDTTIWNNQGVRIWIAHYKNDLLQGDTEEFSGDGVRVALVPYRDGKRHGTEQRWDKTGKPIGTYQWENGRLLH